MADWCTGGHFSCTVHKYGLALSTLHSKITNNGGDDFNFYISSLYISFHVPFSLFVSVDSHALFQTVYPSIHPSGPYSVQSVGAAEVVSWAIGHNPARVATPTQDTRIAQPSQQAGTHFVDLGRMTG